MSTHKYNNEWHTVCGGNKYEGRNHRFRTGSDFTEVMNIPGGSVMRVTQYKNYEGATLLSSALTPLPGVQWNTETQDWMKALLT